MIKLGAVIMAHPQRAEFVSELQGQLDRPVDVVWDRRDDRWDTGRRAMEAFDPSATHHVVLQDDCVPSAHLLAGVEKALAYAPSLAPVCLYVGRVRQFTAVLSRELPRTSRVSWVRMRDVNWGVGIAVPTATIPDMLDYCERNPHPNYDGRVGGYYRYALRQWAWYTWPSLVDHRRSASLVQGRTAMRSAYKFAGKAKRADAIDFSGPIVTVNAVRGPE